MKVFITGGTTGIGLELCRFYLNQGDEVGVCGRDLSKMPEHLKSYERLKLYECDVLELEKLKAAVVDFVGDSKLDIMIANAGRSVGSKSKTPNFQVARDVVGVNVIGVINTFEAAYPHLNRPGGQLVAMASVAGFVGLPGASSYSASKAAVIKYCESLSLDLKREGISVTTICPGFIDTPLTQKNDHGMPFLMSADKGARMIAGAVEKRRALYIFPWPMKFAILFLTYIPRGLYRFLMSFKALDYSKK
jgi:short-subunit dehydrogenase